MLQHTESEQRTPFYRDIEKLLVPGFISQRITVQGRPVSLRSLSSNDLYLLGHWTYGNRDWRVWSIAASIWMFDGILVLDRRSETVPIIAEYLSKMAPGAIHKMFVIVMGLFRRSREATARIQSYLYETQSRTLWQQSKNGDFLDDRFLGVPGASMIGMNSMQKVWVMWNQAEDQRDSDRIEWAMTRSLISAHNPKGAKKMMASEKTREQRERSRKQQIMDEMYYRSVGVLSDDDFILGPDGETGVKIRGASTTKELSEELRRWVSGEEDHHDKVVREYKEGILSRMRQAREDRHREIQEVRQAAEDHAALHGVTMQPLVGYTPSQLKELLITEGRGEGQQGTRRMYENPMPEKAESWLEKPSPPPRPGEFKNHPAARSLRKDKDINTRIQRRRPSVLGQ